MAARPRCICACAGLKPVLIEKDYAGRHASGVNAGGVRQLARAHRRDPALDPLDGIWETIDDLVDDDCGFESHGQVLVAENEEELAASARASTNCRARLHPRGADRRDRAAAAGAGGGRDMSGRRGVAARRRGRSVPHHAGLPAQGASSSARRARGRGGHRTSAYGDGSGGSRPAPDLRGAGARQRRRRLGRPDRGRRWASRCRSRPWRRC